MTVSAIPSVAYLRMHVELTKGSLEDLAPESLAPQCLAHLREILQYLSTVNRTKDIEAVYLSVEGGKDRVRGKCPGEHFEVVD
jgi:hypothetical protein